MAMMKLVTRFCDNQLSQANTRGIAENARYIKERERVKMVVV
jgi:hypothetical protein